MTRDFAPGLCTGIAHDIPHNILTVGATQLEGWRVTADQAFEQSLSNLQEKTDTPRFKELAKGLYLGDWGDCYDTSRILIPEMIHRLFLNGDPVVFLPDRDTLFVTGAYSTAALSLILKHGAPIHFEQGHLLSPNLYVHSVGEWKLFTPGDPVVAIEARAVRYRRESMDYEQQKKYLEDLHKIEKLDIFVASCQLVKRNDSSLFTRCVWTKGVDSLLPVMETLTLLIDIKTKEMLNLSWEKAWPVVSQLLERFRNLCPSDFVLARSPPRTSSRLCGILLARGSAAIGQMFSTHTTTPDPNPQ